MCAALVRNVMAHMHLHVGRLLSPSSPAARFLYYKGVEVSHAPSMRPLSAACEQAGIDDRQGVCTGVDPWVGEDDESTDLLVG